MHEYQDRSSMRSDAYGQVGHSHMYDSALDGPSARTSYMHGNEQMSRAHGLSHVSRGRHASQSDRQGHALSSHPDDEDSLVKIRMNSQYTGHPVIKSESIYTPHDGHILHNDSDVRTDRKRKVGQ